MRLRHGHLRAGTEIDWGFGDVWGKWVDTNTNQKKTVQLQPREQWNRCEFEGHPSKLPMLLVFGTFARVARCYDQNPDSQHDGTYWV